MYIAFILIFIIILPFISCASFYFVMVNPLEKNPIIYFVDYLKNKDKLHYLFPFCFVFFNLFLNISKSWFAIICIISSFITLFTVALKYDLFFSYLENLTGLPQNYIIMDFVSSGNIYLFLCLWFIGTINITFRAFLNWSRMLIISVIMNRFEYIEVIKEKTISVFPTWRTIIDFTFHRTSNRIYNQRTIINNIQPNNSMWMKAGVLTGVGVLGASFYAAGESHFTRVAAEKSADASVKQLEEARFSRIAAERSVEEAHLSRVAAEKSADVAAVQAKLMTKEEFDKRYPKNK